MKFRKGQSWSCLHLIVVTKFEKGFICALCNNASILIKTFNFHVLLFGIYLNMLKLFCIFFFVFYFVSFHVNCWEFQGMSRAQGHFDFVKLFLKHITFIFEQISETILSSPFYKWTKLCLFSFMCILLREQQWQGRNK